jgi:hypothetical protein
VNIEGQLEVAGVNLMNGFLEQVVVVVVVVDLSCADDVKGLTARQIITQAATSESCRCHCQQPCGRHRDLLSPPSSLKVIFSISACEISNSLNASILRLNLICWLKCAILTAYSSITPSNLAMLPRSCFFGSFIIMLLKIG